MGKAHYLKTYMDGNVHVVYCEICSSEDPKELYEQDCKGKFERKLDRPVDSKS